MQQQISGLSVMFIAGFGPITRDTPGSKAFYRDTLGLPLKGMENNEDYLLTEPGELDKFQHHTMIFSPLRQNQ